MARDVVLDLDEMVLAVVDQNLVLDEFMLVVRIAGQFHSHVSTVQFDLYLITHANELAGHHLRHDAERDPVAGELLLGLIRLIEGEARDEIVEQIPVSQLRTELALEARVLAVAFHSVEASTGILAGSQRALTIEKAIVADLRIVRNIFAEIDRSAVQRQRG